MNVELWGFALTISGIGASIVSAYVTVKVTVRHLEKKIEKMESEMVSKTVMDLQMKLLESNIKHITESQIRLENKFDTWAAGRNHAE